MLKKKSLILDKSERSSASLDFLSKIFLNLNSNYQKHKKKII